MVTLPLGRAIAQENIKQEFSFTGGLGLSTLKYDLDNGDSKQKFGGNIGIGYSYFFNESFGLNTGLEFSFLKSEANIIAISDRYMTTDSEGDSFELRSEVGNYEETQSAMYMNIPIMGQYQMNVEADHKFYAALGFKIGIPITSKYKTQGADLSTAGFYKQYDNTLLENHPMEGFGSFTSQAVDKKLDMKVAFMLAAEVGMKWYLTESLAFYTAAYIDYGLNDVSKRHDDHFMLYNTVNPSKYINNSILTSEYTQNTNTEKFADKVIPMSIGLKLKFAFKMAQ